jgi:hypothetical protein
MGSDLTVYYLTGFSHTWWFILCDRAWRHADSVAPRHSNFESSHRLGHIQNKGSETTRSLNRTRICAGLGATLPMFE